MALFESYFFLYPFGHAGLVAVTFLLVLPLMQVMDFLAIGAGLVVACAVACGAGASCVNFTLIVGDEKVKFLAVRNSH